MFDLYNDLLFDIRTTNSSSLSHAICTTISHSRSVKRSLICYMYGQRSVGREPYHTLISCSQSVWRCFFRDPHNDLLLATRTTISYLRFFWQSHTWNPCCEISISQYVWWSAVCYPHDDLSITISHAYKQFLNLGHFDFESVKSRSKQSTKWPIGEILQFLLGRFSPHESLGSEGTWKLSPFLTNLHKKNTIQCKREPCCNAYIKKCMHKKFMNNA